MLARAQINRIFVAIVVLTNTFGNLLLALGMSRMPDFFSLPFGAYCVRFLTDWQVFVGIALLAAWMVAQLTMLSWADLSYVLPVTASGYVLTAFLGQLFLHEHISVGRWMGVMMIAAGSILASVTPIKTAHPEERAR